MTARGEIRPVGAGDRADWQRLWTAYLEFYRTSVSPRTYDVTWTRLQDPREPMHLLGAYDGGALRGIAHYIFQRSCWTEGDYCYLQDLFVDPSARGRGFGRGLIEAVCREAKAAGASRVHWLTHESNAGARALYDTLAERPGFIQYRRIF